MGKININSSRKPWPTSLVIFAIWVIIVLGGELLQVGGKPTQLDELAKNQIIFGVLTAAVFLLGVITYLKWWPEVAGKEPDNLRDLRLLWLPSLVLFLLLLIVLFTGLPPTTVLMFVIINTLLYII
ncbi:hypothetical protein EO95_18410 [Methanosarcina sp. 1.H.T.1A.1]|nr:hypothetical protein EO95_18410 [Methanosarcina sp. 1.H.T.1A.1]